MRQNQKISPVAGISLYRRLLSGGGERPTRLHDNFGRRVSLSRALRNGTRAMATGIIRVIAGRRPERPWISYDAQARIARFLTKDSSVLEYGSGMSTIWFARHAGRVVSVEDNSDWYEHIGERLRALGNVDYVFAGTPDDYVALAPEQAFDLYLIDGHWRDRCVDAALRSYRPGAMVYLDNSDKGNNPETTGDIPAARAKLLAFAEREGLQVREFIDFSPTQFFVESGLMIGPERVRPV